MGVPKAGCQMCGRRAFCRLEATSGSNVFRRAMRCACLSCTTCPFVRTALFQGCGEGAARSALRTPPALPRHKADMHDEPASPALRSLPPITLAVQCRRVSGWGSPRLYIPSQFFNLGGPWYLASASLPPGCLVCSSPTKWCMHACAGVGGDAVEVEPLPCKRGLRTMHCLLSPSPHSQSSQPILSCLAAAAGGGRVLRATGLVDTQTCVRMVHAAWPWARCRPSSPSAGGPGRSCMHTRRGICVNLPPSCLPSCCRQGPRARESGGAHVD